MHVALFGASFDPPHTAHRIIAEQVLDQKLADQVWFVPVKDHPFHKTLSPENYRLQMVKLMAQVIDRPEQIQVNEFELQQDRPSYSFQTLKAMAQKYPEHTFSWVIGSDNLASFPKWYEVKQLLQNFPVYVYPRKGSETDALLPGMQLIDQVPEVEISSTMVREKVAQGQSIAGLVEPEVEQYIKENGLYAV